MTLIQDALTPLLTAGPYRRLPKCRELIDFSSNDYLGLSRDDVVRAQLMKELEDGCPLGATGSPLVTGYTIHHERTEAFLQKAFATPSALVFNSGFSANMSVINALAGAEFFSDELNHASLIDGMRLLRSPIHIFAHNDMDHLRNLLIRSRARHRAIVTESVFSQDGDLAPLDELLELSERFDAWLVVDEAHATGVFGAQGLGRMQDRCHKNLITVHTASKALGGQGAFVLSCQSIRDLIINRSRSFIYSTALAPLSCLQIMFATEALFNHKRGAGQRLLERAAQFRLSLPLKTRSESQIIPIVLGDNERVLRASRTLQARGFNIRAMRFPTVARGSERLRITLKSTQTEAELLRLTEALRELT